MTLLRNLAVLCAAIAAVALLPGCSGSNDDDSSNNNLSAPEIPVSDKNYISATTQLETLAAELKANGGEMVAAYETTPALLAEYIGQDKALLDKLNEQLKTVHVTRSNSGNANTKTTDQTVEDGGDENVAFVLGDLVPMNDSDFPPLADIVDNNTWLDKPVLDAMDLMRQRQEGEEPLATVQEALNMTNTTNAINLKIRSAMGRLANTDGSGVNYDASWSRHTSGDVKITNGIMMSSSAEFDVSGLINFGLFGFDWTFTPYGAQDSIVSWQYSDDGLFDKVVLRDDLFWSDGTRITAHDVEFSYRVIMTSKVPVPAVRSGTDQLRGVKAYDDKTVIFFHPDPLATNIWNIMFPIIPKHIYENSVAEDPTMASSAYHVEQDENPVTGGAYTITKRVRGQEIVLERRDGYHTVNGEQVRDIPYFKTIRFVIINDPSTALLSMKKDDLEEMILTPEQWTEQTDTDDFESKNIKAYDIEWVYFYFGWNLRSPFFRDVRVRKAMGLAFNHAELMTRHRKGMDEQSTGVFHRTSPWAPDTAPTAGKQDFDKAEDLLAEAGWEDTDGDGVLDGMAFTDPEFDGQLNGVKRLKFEFTIVTSNRPDRIALCELLAENLDQIGVDCHVRPVEFTVLQQTAREHKFHAQFAGWGTGTDPDTSDNLWTTKAIDSGRNYVCYSNPEIDKLFFDGKYELDPDKRRAIYQQIHLKLYEDQPYTWLYFRNSYFAFSKQLRGYNFSPRGPYNYGPGEGSIFKSPVMQ